MKGFMNIVKNEKGVVSVFLAFAMVAIMGFTALVIDVGLLFVERNKLVNALDSASLAGAQELPTKPLKAREIAENIAKVNGVPSDNINILLNTNNTEIMIEGYKEVDYLFADILGIDKGSVAANSGAIIGSASVIYNGARPLVVEKQILTYGAQVVLKEDSGDGISGNYGVVALGATGSKNFESNLIYGYEGRLKIGDVIYTETGNMSGATYNGVKHVVSTDPSATFDSYERDSSRIWTIPVIDSLEVKGRKPVTIVGFAAFFVEGVKKKSGQTEIKGRFIEFATNADIDTTIIDYGLKGIKLVK